MITTAIGLILVFLMLSLLVTSIQELLAGWFAMRGKMLEQALEGMLTNKAVKAKEATVEKSLFHRFQAHNWYQDLTPKKAWYSSFAQQAPDYISPTAFATILLHILDGSDGEKLATTIHNLPDGHLKTFLSQTLTDADHKVDVFKVKLEHWYDETMNRVSGWYKKKVHQIILLISLIVAVTFNADTLSMYQKLATDPEARLATLAEAQKLLGEDLITNDATLATAPNRATLAAVQQQVNTLITEDFEAIHSPLGLGWHQSDIRQLDEEGFVGWSKKILGLLITVFAISLGAPFWFDLLNQFMHIRNAGKKTDPQIPSPPSPVTIKTN